MHRLKKLYIEIPAFEEGRPGAYGLAVAIAAIATGLRVAIDPYVAGVQYITFFPAVIVATLISGLRAGALCVVLSTLAAWVFILPPKWTLEIANWEQGLGLALFILVATADVMFISAMRFAIRRFQDLSGTMEQRVVERTAELMKTQGMLAQAQKMDAVGQLTGGLAHDFNNMLAIIIGNLDIVKRRLAKGQTDIGNHLDNALEGASRAAQLTRRLLAFARHQPLSPDVIDVNKLTLDTSELLRRTLGERVTVECVQAGGLWKAHVNSSELESAIVNLAVNARDAMPEGGALTIETANAYLDDKYAALHDDVSPGQYVVVAVSDTGTGMSPDVMARAVEPFFTTKEAGKGTGLGLSQVYGFARQSRGHMAIYSEEGRGTTIRLYLPRAYGATAANAKAYALADEILPAGSKRETILLVEDEDHVRRMSAAALRELGYRVCEAANGMEALALLDDEPSVKLLFTDVVMPGMDGRKLAEAAQRKYPAIKVLYTTGYTRNAIVHDGTLDPDVDLIVKPFTVDQLARKVRAVLTGGKPAEAARP